MNKKNILFFLVFLLKTNLFAQKIDSTAKITTYSGSVGLTNNGFAIVPSFSLNSPAMIMLLSWKRNKFSFDPDVRLTLNGKKGGAAFWVRYHAIEKEKFNFRIGAHPAINLQARDIISNNATTNITQMRRFLAWELVPSYRFSKHFIAGLYYLQGNGLQKDGPQTSHFINFYTVFANLKLSKEIRLTFSPAVFYLNLDSYEGKYFSANTTLSHVKFPLTLTSAINKTISSDLPGNKDLLWNVGVNYIFRKKLAHVK